MFLIIVLLSVVYLVRSYITLKADIKDIEADIFNQETIFTKNGITYKDEITGRSYPGIIDFNKMQIDGWCCEVKEQGAYRKKWENFGWYAIETDGHNFESLDKAFKECETVKDKPQIIIAHTIKGKGVSFVENKVEWHGIAPKKDEYRKNLARSLEKAGKLDEAIEQHETITRLNREDMDSLYSLTNLYARKKNDRKLIDTYGRILKIDSTKASVHDKLALLLTKRKDYVKGISHSKKAIQYAPKNLTYRINLAKAYEKSGDLKRALEEYELVYEKDPSVQEAKEKIPALNLEILRRKHEETE